MAIKASTRPVTGSKHMTKLNPKNLVQLIKRSKTLLPSSLVIFATCACSFVELNPAARHIIFADNQENCTLIELFAAEVAIENAFIDRTELAIAEELQILAQNEAFEKRANAIWPNSEIIDGKQSFKLLKCTYSR
jgi:hypothetical protein